MTGAVVCGVDWRDDSHVAVDVAKWLSDRLGARLVLVHVAPTPIAPTISVYPGGQAELAYQEQRDAEELLAEVAASTRLDDAAAERRVAFGDPAEQLAALAADERAQLLVVASRGRRRLRAALLGSVASELAAHAPCPVVIVPANLARA